MKLADFSFQLPDELVAQFPVSPRDHSRLMLLDRENKKITHHFFYELPTLLPSHCALVANHSKVIRSRLLGHRILEDGTQGGKIEFFLLKPISEKIWEGLVKSSAKVKPGFKFKVKDLVGEVIEPPIGEKDGNGTFFARFSKDPLADHYGEIPLPPYIDRKAVTEDETHYQTCYAKSEGSAAAPTAGLHFTPELLKKVITENRTWNELSLHVGIGTFRPVKVSNISEHIMHTENYTIEEQTALTLNQAKQNQSKIIAIGTTSLRALETSVVNGKIVSGQNETDIFIYPHGPKQVQFVDQLITNFHLPESSLFMLVCAFAGFEFAHHAYKTAIEMKYRFFSYGDAMWIR